jgi:protein KTI12
MSKANLRFITSLLTIISNQLLIISGFPCSGKTHRSRQLVKYFTDRIAASSDPKVTRLQIHHINDEGLGLKPNVYHAAREEKDARAAEMSAVKRLLGQDSIVIADGPNYIKGFRYQLYCEAKALHTPSCVVRDAGVHYKSDANWSDG